MTGDRCLVGLFDLTAVVFTPKRLKSDVVLVTTVKPLTEAVAVMMASGVLILNCVLSPQQMGEVATLVFCEL
jgi:hypothetical protein